MHSSLLAVGALLGILLLICLVAVISIRATFKPLPRASGLGVARAAPDLDIVMVSYDDRDVPYVRDAFAMNRLYCERRGYTWVQRSGVPYDMPPYWAKVRLVQDVMAEHPACDYVVWIDSDAAVVEHAVRWEDQLAGLPDGAMSSDPFRAEPNNNAGVFAIRNSEQGRALLREWLAMYNPTAWQQSSSGAWACPGCDWAGIEYEQGSFAKMLREAKYNMSVMPPHVSWWGKPSGEPVFIVHLMGGTREKRDAQFRQARALVEAKGSAREMYMLTSILSAISM